MVLVVTQYKYSTVLVTVLVLRAAMTRLLTVCLEADAHLSQAHLTLLQAGDQDEEQAQEEEQLQGSEDALEEDRAAEKNEVEREKREGGEEKALEEESLSESDDSEETEYIQEKRISDLEASENEEDTYERGEVCEGSADNLERDDGKILENGGDAMHECSTGSSDKQLAMEDSFDIGSNIFEVEVTKNSLTENDIVDKCNKNKQKDESPRESLSDGEREVQRKRSVEPGGLISSVVLGEFLDDDDEECQCAVDEESVFGDDLDSSFGVRDEDNSFDARSECEYDEIKIKQLHEHHSGTEKGDGEESVTSVDKDSVKEEDSSLCDSLTEVQSELDVNADREKDVDSAGCESADGTANVRRTREGLRLKTKDEVDAAIRWIKDFPAPLPGPKCTCKVPGTPPWKLAQPSFFPATETPKLSYTTTVLSLDKQLVTVKLRRPRSSSFNPQTVRERSGDPAGGEAHANRRGRVSLGEGELNFSSDEASVPHRGNSKDLKEKRRVLRSWSFWGSRSSQDDVSSTPAVAPSPFSSPPSRSSPLCGSSTLASLASPLRWSRAPCDRRKNAQSCIFPDAYTPPAPVSGGLASRVSSEPSVTPRTRSGSQGEVNVTPRRFSKSLSSKRKAVRSCIFPDTVSEDYTPYMVSTPNEYEEIATKAVSLSPNPRGMSPDSFASRCDSGYRTPEPRITRSESQLVRSEPPRVMPESRAKKGLSRPRRPQSLIIIPETQVGVLEPPMRRLEVPPRRPQSLIIPPPEVLIPRRTSRASPRDAPLRPTRRHSISQFPLWSPGGEANREMLAPHSQSPRTCRPTHVHGLSPAAARSVEPVVRRATSSAERDRRRHVHSWSFSPSVSVVPFNPMISLSEGRPLQSGVARTLRPRPLFPKDAEVFEHPPSEA